MANRPGPRPSPWLAAIALLAGACVGDGIIGGGGGARGDAATALDAAFAPDAALSVDAPGRADAGSADAGQITYSTKFDGTESPISERGAWVHRGLDWARVDTEGGIALGTQTGTGLYDDSYAHLTGFPPDVIATAVVHKAASIDPSCTHEVEIHLRWSDAAHDAHGYECLVAYDGSYAQIVRWNGPLGDFTYLDPNGSVPGGVHDGDTVSASVIGDQITLYVNGVRVAQARDSMWTDGNPGMGFWRGGAGPCGTRGDFGFTSYTASSL